MRRSLVSMIVFLSVGWSIASWETPTTYTPTQPTTTRPAMAVQPPVQRAQAASIQSAIVTPTPTPTPIPQPTVQVTVQDRVQVGTKYDWIRAAGIPQSDWQYVDYIVTRESGWNPNAVNPSSGACGLGQQLPCGKWAGAWNDPVAALKAQHQYVLARYGSYSGAHAFWLANHWY